MSLSSYISARKRIGILSPSPLPLMPITFSAPSEGLANLTVNLTKNVFSFLNWRDQFTIRETCRLFNSDIYQLEQHQLLDYETFAGEVQRDDILERNNVLTRNFPRLQSIAKKYIVRSLSYHFKTELHLFNLFNKSDLYSLQVSQPPLKTCERIKFPLLRYLHISSFIAPVFDRLGWSSFFLGCSTITELRIDMFDCSREDNTIAANLSSFPNLTSFHFSAICHETPSPYSGQTLMNFLSSTPPANLRELSIKSSLFPRALIAPIPSLTMLNLNNCAVVDESEPIVTPIEPHMLPPSPEKYRSKVAIFKESCPNIASCYINSMSLPNPAFPLFTSTLVRLILERCSIWSRNFFYKLKDNVPNLTHLTTINCKITILAITLPISHPCLTEICFKQIKQGREDKIILKQKTFSSSTSSLSSSSASCIFLTHCSNVNFVDKLSLGLKERSDRVKASGKNQSINFEIIPKFIENDFYKEIVGNTKVETNK